MGVRYGEVALRAERVLVVANGPSLRTMPLKAIADAAGRGAHVLAVNGAIEALPVCHSWFTLDPCGLNRRRMMVRRVGVTYFAAVPPDYGLAAACRRCHRGRPASGVTYLRRIAGAGLPPGPGLIHSGNSAFGALQLAAAMGAARIVLAGVDGTQRPYAYGRGRPGKLGHLPGLFAGAVADLGRRGIKVVNASPQSLVDCFPRMAAAEALDWLTEAQDDGLSIPAL